MQSFIIIFVVFIFIGSVQPQSWLGSYTPSSTCPPSLCCCVSGQVVVSTVSAGFVSFTTGLSGGLPCGYSPTYTTNMSTPSGYVATLTISGIVLTFNLNSNSLSINVTSTQGSSCQGLLTKNVTATSNPTSSTSLGLINTMPPSKNGLLYIMTFIGLIRSVWSM